MSKKMVWHMIKTMFSVMFYCAVIVGICYLFSFGYYFMYQAFSNPVYDSSTDLSRTVTVNEGQSSLSVMRTLEEKDIIEDYRVAYVRLNFSKYEGEIKPGKYYVSASMPLDSILGTLAQDSEVTETSLQDGR